MKVGITFDLRSSSLAMGYSREETAELDSEDTIEAIEAAVAATGRETERIGSARDLARRLEAGDRWDLVFNIAEGHRGLGRESLVPCLLEEYGVHYTFSDPMVLALSLHKGMCKRAIRDMGIPTAPFAVVSSPGEVAGVELRYPLFAKPVAEGTSKGIGDLSLIETEEQLRSTCGDIIERFKQPALVEEFLPGREFTIGIVGTGLRARVLGMMEVLDASGAEAPIYSYDAKEDYEARIKYRSVPPSPLRDDLSSLALDSWRGLGCRDAGRMDLRIDREGAPVFMEVNPLAGLNPVRSDLSIMSRLEGKTYQSLIEAILESALGDR